MAETKKKILLVDDDHDTMHVLAQGLHRHGFCVSAHSDPLFALAEFKERYYDLILLDIKMPGMTGFELAKQIWVKDPAANVCFMSAYAIYETEVKVMFTGLKPVYFIGKPVTAKKLAEFINAHIAARHG